MDFYRHLFTVSKKDQSISFFLIYLISIIFTFQSLLTAYSSSTYLEKFIRPESVGLIYAVSALLAIIITILLPRALSKIGNVATLIVLMVLICVSLVMVGFASSSSTVLVAFILLTALSPQVYLNIDIFLEASIGKNEGDTGRKRGLILALMSLAAFFSPLAMSYIVGDNNDLASTYYVASAVGILLIMVIISFFRRFTDPLYTSISLKGLISQKHLNKNVNIVLINQFLLQFFYTWAIIYIPLYLASTIGLSWDVIGKILAVGLFAFVIFEYPIGFLADKHFGEKEMMAGGFVLLALCSASISFYAEATILAWMILMFFSRLGASLVEVTTESYFFKQVDATETNLISLFRLMRPLANFAGAIVGTLTLVFLPFNLIFVVLGLIMVIGAFITSPLTDSK